MLHAACAAAPLHAWLHLARGAPAHGPRGHHARLLHAPRAGRVLLVLLLVSWRAVGAPARRTRHLHVTL